MGEDMRMCLPAPSPEVVRAARAYLTPRYAADVDQVLWELMEHPLSPSPPPRPYGPPTHRPRAAARTSDR